MNATINALLKINGTLAAQNAGAVGQGTILGIQTLETGVFGRVVIGLVTWYLHGRYNKISLPPFLGFSAARALCRSSARWRRWRSAP